MARHLKRTKFAVVGLGNFAQTAILPAFANAEKKARLAALVTGDAEKAAELSKQYKAPAYDYGQYEKLLSSGAVEAVYIAVPNAKHREFAVRAAKAGVHVLCEKPLAYTSKEAQQMIDACRAARVKLMTAYRLHFEEGNLQSIEAIRAGKIGEARLFDSIHTMQVDPDNVRVDLSLGGGPVEDIGIYCINAARYIFQSEPSEVFGIATGGHDSRFKEVPEAVGATMRFPEGRVASFLCGFGETKASEYRVVGTKGMLKMDPAYSWHEDIVQTISVKEKETSRTFKHRDQVAAEILYFSECVQNGTEPEPSGREGLIDVRIIEALRKSYRSGKPVLLKPLLKTKRPRASQSIKREAPKKPQPVKAPPPSKK